MPELPEVETIRASLENIGINNINIKKIFRSHFKLRIANKNNFDLLINSHFTAITRRARYLLLKTSNQLTLIIHLGMSGRITIDNKLNQAKHNHFAIAFDDGKWLIFNDPRRFGFVDLIKNSDIDKYNMLRDLGPEPLSPDFNWKYFANQISGKSTNIKNLIMDNKIVVGVGNIYANESLFMAKILPFRISHSLSNQELKKLVDCIKVVISLAIENKGSSINDYVDAAGNVGNFQNNFKVYGKNKQNCPNCNIIIDRIVQNGRSSFYSQKCQK